MIDPAADDHAEIRSVGRALDLLDFMQRAAPAGIRVRDAAAHLGIDPATASRLLATLISRICEPHAEPALHARRALLAARVRMDRSPAASRSRADDAHRQWLRRDRLFAA